MIEKPKCFTHREWLVYEMFYHEGKTLQEIGDELGVTRERVRQIRNIANEKGLLKAAPELLSACEALLYCENHDSCTDCPIIKKCRQYDGAKGYAKHITQLAKG